MKISKLFHWLYAILMFLPILVFVPNAFYYGFNETAVAQENLTYNTYEIQFNQLVADNRKNNTIVPNGANTYSIYSVSCPLTTDYLYAVRVYIQYNGNLEVRPYVQADNYNYGIPTMPYLNVTNNIVKCEWYLRPNSNVATITLGISNITTSNKLTNNDTWSFSNLNVFNLTSMYGEGNEPTQYEFFNNFPLDNYSYTTGTTMEVVNYNNPIIYTMSITDSMSYAWKSTWQNELFSWSYDSFLTQPFLYISNLFNVPATNTLLYCLSYWLNISIIWLCFDVVMYVPLLVHRWLDKGIIE